MQNQLTNSQLYERNVMHIAYCLSDFSWPLCFSLRILDKCNRDIDNLIILLQKRCNTKLWGHGNKMRLCRIGDWSCKRKLCDLCYIFCYSYIPVFVSSDKITLLSDTFSEDIYLYKITLHCQFFTESLFHYLLHTFFAILLNLRVRNYW